MQKLLPLSTLTIRALVAACAALLFVFPATIRAQSALDGFDPNANGNVFAVALQADGKILVGGQFTAVTPNGGPAVTRNRIARFNADGTLDAGFNPNADGDVYTIVVQPDGKILVGGSLQSVGGQMRRYIARLDPVTGAADSFAPDATARVEAIAVQADGKVIAGGQFAFIGGQSRAFIARLDGTTGAADSFNPGSSHVVYALAVQPDGRILVGGAFTTIGGQPRNRIARLDATGTPDSFNPNASSQVQSLALQPDGKVLLGGNFTQIGGQQRIRVGRVDGVSGLPDSFNAGGMNGDVSEMAVQPDGKVVVGGPFTSVGGQPRGGIARLDPVTGAPDSFNPNTNGFIVAIAVQADGKILAGGVFTSVAPNGGAAVVRNRVARFEKNGLLDQALNLSAVSAAGGTVYTTAGQADGKVIIGGSFSSILGTARNNIARLNTDGTLDLAFNPNASGPVLSIVVQSDKILVGGQFTTIGGQARGSIARLDAATGAVDSFNPNVNSANNAIFCLTVQADGKVLVGGAFSSIGGQPRNNIARVDAAGVVDSFTPNASDFVRTIAVQSDGKILVGGTFGTIAGQARNRIARLDPASGAADSFNPAPAGGANVNVIAIALQPDGKILVGGLFTSIGGQARNSFARLDPTTGAADSFDPSVNASVFTLAVQSDGKVVLGGTFTSVGGQPRNRIARVDATGAVDSFNPDANNFVQSVSLQADGKVLVGGTFSTIGGQARNLCARLTNDTAALSMLTVAKTALTLTRSGSAPQFTRVTFEQSLDNGATYTVLGNGTPSASSYTLTGLNLPSGQNVLVRARGFYRMGYSNGSESLEEKVQLAFFPLPPPTPSQVVSRKMHNGTPYDISLPLSGNVGIECRGGGAANDYQLLFTFPSAVTFSSATVSSGAGSVSSSSGSGTTTATVNLTGVTSAQTIMVTLIGVNNLGDVGAPMGVLVGDTNASRGVNATDIGQTKAASGQAVDGTNFRQDVNVSGAINASDIGLVKAQSGSSLP